MSIDARMFAWNRRLWCAAAPVLALAAGAAAQPVNDLCSNAIAIGNTTVAGTTTGASNDGSAGCGASASNVDVWYRYTASATTTITATLCNPGTTYDTVLSVHTPNCPGTSGTQIVCDDDASCDSGGLKSTVSFSAVAGNQYLVRVSGYSSSSGDFELSIGPGNGHPPPPNDSCDGASAVGDGSFNGTTNSATPDGSSDCSANSTPDVYYLYTAPTTRTVTAATCAAASFDTVISVHSGCPATSANQIACNNDSCGLRSEVNFDAVAGNQYIIRVAGNSGAGTFTLTLGDPPPPGPNGPDVTYRDAQSVFNWGAVGGIQAYSLGSVTCNIGDENLLWSSFGTPALAMNAFRLSNGRLMQIGLGFCKTACCAGAGSGCGSCNGAGGSVLGAGCQDVYGSSYNGGQSHLAPRSVINAYAGTVGSFPQTSGDAIYRRLQVQRSDMNSVSFPNSLYFVEGHYISSDDAPAGNDMNNASYRRVTINQSSYDMALADAQQMAPAIQAWHDYGLGVNTPDPSVNVFSIQVPGEGHYWVATKVTMLGENDYLYDYAVYNYNSDLSGGSLTVPKTANVTISNIGFHDVNYHSGEPYDNTDWVNSTDATSVVWHSPQTFADNPNSNALRWGTMYNFWFEANTPPATGQITLGMFKPHDPDSVSFDGPVPSHVCVADWNHDNTVNSQDFFDFLASFFASNADFNSDGVTNSQDFFDFLTAFFLPC